MLVFLILAIGILPALLYLYVQWQYTFWKRNNMPFVKPTFPHGTVFSKKKHLAYHLADFYLTKKNDYPMLGLYFFHDPSAVIVDLELIRCILIKDFQYFQSRGIFYNEDVDPLSAHLANLGIFICLTLILQHSFYLRF